MTYESQKDRFARLAIYVRRGTYRPGAHKDPNRRSEFSHFAMWLDGAESLDSLRDAKAALKEFTSAKDYREDERGFV